MWTECDQLFCSPWRSARRQSLALQLPNATVRLIVHKDLSFHPHKVQLVQELSDRDVENRQRSYEQFRELLSDDDLQNNLIMTDEAHFNLLGNVNKQNVRYWAPDNTRKMHQRPFTVPRLLYAVAWLPLELSALISLRPRTVTSARYLHLLQTFVVPQINCLGHNCGSYGANRMGPQPYSQRIYEGPAPNVSQPRRSP
jgi:hypothetical protein